MSYPEAATKAGIEVKGKLSEKHKITNLGPACQFLGIEIHCEDTGISFDPNRKLKLGRGSGGDAIGRYQRLLSSRGITNERSTCNSARYLVCGRSSFSLQFAAIHQPYDRWQESPSVSQIYSRFSTTLQRQWHRHGHRHRHRHRQ